MFGNHDIITERLAAAIQRAQPVTELRKLVSSGADVNGHIYEEPFLIASITFYQDQEAALYLLGAGSDPGIPDDLGMTAGMHALQKGPAFQQAARMILARTGMHNQQDGNGRNSLWYAAPWASADLLSEIHEQCVILDFPDEDGRTPLMHAADHANRAAAAWFLSHGSSVHTRDLGGMTALMLASSYDEDPNRRRTIWEDPDAQTKTVRLLCEAGSEVNAADYDGRTALMYAVVADAVETAELLVEVGALTGIRDAAGKRALEIAQGFRSEKMISFLEQKM